MRVLALCFCSLLAATPSLAQSTLDIKRCRQITDSVERLSCFDRVVPLDKSINSPKLAEKMKVVDFLADFKELNGKEVTVSGFAIASTGDQLYLYPSRGEMNAIIIDIKNVDREGRRTALAGCGSGCDIEVTGKGRNTFGHAAIAASRLVVR